MDPRDLLFLHAQLAGTIREQQDAIIQLQAEVTRLTEELGKKEPSSPEEPKK